MNKFSFSRKFSILIVIAITAVCIALFNLHRNLNQIVVQSDREIEGLAIVQPIVHSIQLIQQHRDLSSDVIGGLSDFNVKREKVEAEVEKSLKLLGSILPDNADARIQMANVQSRWERIKGSRKTLSRIDNFSAQTQLIEELMMFRSIISDDYGLTSDSDLDAFYLSVAGNELLRVIESIGQIRSYGTGILIAKEASVSQRAEMVMLTMLLDYTLKPLEININKTARYNEDVKTELLSTYKNIQKSSEEVASNVRSDIIGERFSMSPEVFFAITTGAIDNGYKQMYETIIPSTKKLIKARIERTERIINVAIAISIFIILTIIYLIMAIYHSMIGSINELSRSVQDFIHGDRKHRVHLKTKDELTLIGDSFNRMADDLDNLMNYKMESTERISAIFNSSPDGMVQINAAGEITGWNRQSEVIFGWYSDQIVGKNISTIIPKWNHHGNTRILDLFTETSSDMTLSTHIEALGLDSRGNEIPVEVTVVRFEIHGHYEFNAFIRDITVRKMSESEIANLAFYDPLTQLPNRRLLMDRLNHAINASARSGMYGALMFIDLDNFKTLNDTLGHDVGDLLLKRVSERLVACLRDCDTVARLGGDEFVILIENMSDNEPESAIHAEHIATKVLRSLNQPYKLLTHDYNSTPSIGATIICPNNHSADEFLKQADIAMYQSKKSGRNAIRFFDPDTQKSIQDKAALEADLRKAVINDELRLFYQIQVDNMDNAIGVEALIRWDHPTRGMVNPADFIPLAEETGMIKPIGKWVLDSACAQLKLWKNNPATKNLSMSINVSAKQFHESKFAEYVKVALQSNDISAKLLTIELTESMLQSNVADTIQTMLELRKLGIQFALDDFGTGFSSLQYLKKLPIDMLKIDISFISDIVSNHYDRSIVRTIIAMAKSMNIDVIAEGVETEDQRLLILSKGCTAYQGYLFSRPLPLEAFESMIEDQYPVR